MFTNGVYKILYIKISGTYFPIGCLTTNSFSESSETISTTTRENSDGWKTFVATGQTYNIAFDGLTEIVPSVNTVSYRQIQALKRGRTQIEWKIENGKGDDVDYGVGLITDLSDSAEIDSYLAFNGTIIGYGEPLIELASIVYEFDVYDDVYE